MPGNSSVADKTAHVDSEQYSSILFVLSGFRNNMGDIASVVDDTTSTHKACSRVFGRVSVDFYCRFFDGAVKYIFGEAQALDDAVNRIMRKLGYWIIATFMRQQTCI